MDNDGYKIVLFNKYCKNCKHCSLKENEDPCEQCLEEPVNLYSERPFFYEPKDEESATK